MRNAYIRACVYMCVLPQEGCALRISRARIRMCATVLTHLCVRTAPLQATEKEGGYLAGRANSTPQVEAAVAAGLTAQRGGAYPRVLTHAEMCTRMHAHLRKGCYGSRKYIP